MRSSAEDWLSFARTSMREPRLPIRPPASTPWLDACRRSSKRTRICSRRCGRSMASTLFDAGLVQELYLTTTLKSAGKPGTPFYVGSRRPHLEPVLRKRLLSGRGEPAVLFEHLKVRH